MTAYLFSGQGSQYMGMCKDLYDKYQSVRDVFNEADEALGFSLSNIVFNKKELLDTTMYAQPAIVTMSYAIYKLIESFVITGGLMAGFSVGEYTALAAADAIKFSDVIKVVRQRGLLMQEAANKNKGAMMAVMGSNQFTCQMACKAAGGYVVCANYNSPIQIVLSGEVNSIAAAERYLIVNGAKRTVKLNVSGAFHSDMMKSAVPGLKEALDKIKYSKFTSEVYSNLEGEKYLSPADISYVLAKQITSPVHWNRIIDRFIEGGVTEFVEIGPGKVLTGFVRSINKIVNVCNIENLETFNEYVKTHRKK